MDELELFAAHGVTAPPTDRMVAVRASDWWAEVVERGRARARYLHEKFGYKQCERCPVRIPAFGYTRCQFCRRTRG